MNHQLKRLMQSEKEKSGTPPPQFGPTEQAEEPERKVKLTLRQKFF